MALKSMRLGLNALAFAVVAATFAAARATAQEIEIFNVPASQGITLGPDGAMWLPIGLNAIGRMETNGTVTGAFPLPNGITLPAGIAAGPDGNLWFTTRLPSAIGRITPFGTIRMFPLSPSSLPYAITAGPDGNLWFTMPGSNSIGRITTSGMVTAFPVPTASAGLAGIAAGPDGHLWFAESLANRIGRITTDGDITEFALDADSRPNGIAAGPDGNIWFTEQAARVGRITPGGILTEFPAPPFAAAITSAYGALWLARPLEITRVTTSGITTSYNALLLAPSAVGIATDSEGRVWITEGVLGFVGRILRLEETQPGPCVADATTLCLNDGRFRVRAALRTGGGAAQDARAVGLTADSGYFWFFDPANIELVLKVLDGCSLNGHYWNFLAGLTNVEVTTTITDTVSGVSKVYTNTGGTAFAPVQDTLAFATCP